MSSVLGPIVASVEANFSVGVAYCRGECIRIHGTLASLVYPRVPHRVAGCTSTYLAYRREMGKEHDAPRRPAFYHTCILFAFSKGLAFRLTQDALHCTLLSNGKSPLHTKVHTVAPLLRDIVLCRE